MKIVGIEDLSAEELNRELERGGEFVVFQYVISILILTFRRSSNIHFIREGESKLLKSLPFSIITLFFGWWGIPWGPVYSIGSLVTNLRGGKVVTQDVIASLNQNNLNETAVSEM